MKPTPPANPRTVTSASLRSNSSSSSVSAPTSSAIRTTKGPTRLGAVSTASGTSARPAKLGLGAKKAVSSINFEEAEAKARAEEERAKELELKAHREAEEEKARRTAATVAATPTQTSNPLASTSTSAKSAPASSSSKAPGGQDVERLGIGFKRLGFGANAAPAAAPRKATTEDAPTTAREKFGNQKAISSDMFFDRGTYDPAAVSEARTKLSQFQGATSISSNQYFGREDGEEDEGEGADGSFTGNESLSALEAATRDAVSRVLAREDVQNAAETIRAGALKVSMTQSRKVRTGLLT